MIKKGNWSKEEDLEVIRLFKLGYTSKKIGEKLDRTKEAVQKRIQNFKIEGIINEEERKLKQIENRDIKRAFNKENNSYIRNRDLIKRCISVYKTNDFGDIVLDEEKAKIENFVFPENMPKIMK
ncbi:hypothetical protein [uncultured Clostridium sp.]|jgi:hypothetical protein|uniref:hypothetical protein n=1 Tax=uncultured Clostridium sp. TaxID=59620 RepID=UPI0025CF4901|nr:hypothetical protein [uncultured Clostridium sp.]